MNGHTADAAAAGRNARLDTFLLSLEGPSDPEALFFEEQRRRAEADGVPIIRRGMENFLQVLLEISKPEHILEVGTAIGYSAMRMASMTPSRVHITTIENYGPRIREAKKHIGSSPWADRILLIEGDAAEVLGELEDAAYGFVFMDAAKAQYIHYLPQVLRILKTGGLLVSDNVLQDGVILESRYAVERRDRTIHARMREYLKVLCRTEGLVTSIVPVGDGAAVTVKKADKVILPELPSL